jgi:hypothetical protein
MLRPDFFFNEYSIKNKFIKDIEKNLVRPGGVFYSNMYTPGPDTPRSLSSFYTGIEPNLNGCKDRTTWPGMVLNSDDTFFKALFEKQTLIATNLEKDEVDLGFLPMEVGNNMLKISNFDFYNENLQKNNLSKNQFVFLNNTSFHTAITEYSGSSFGVKQGLMHVSKDFKKYFSDASRKYFDEIIVMSDHGCILTSDAKTNPACSDARSKIFMYTYSKHQNKNLFKINQNLSSILDMREYIENLYCSETEARDSQIKNRKYVFIEDYSKIYPAIGIPPDAWSVVYDSGVRVYDDRAINHPSVMPSSDPVSDDKLIMDFQKIATDLSSFYKDFSVSRMVRNALDKTKKNYKKTSITSNRIILYFIKIYALIERTLYKIFK